MVVGGYEKNLSNDKTWCIVRSRTGESRKGASTYEELVAEEKAGVGSRNGRVWNCA